MELSTEWTSYEQSIGMRPRVTGDTIAELRAYADKAKEQRVALPASESLSITDEHLGGFRVRIYKPKTASRANPSHLGIFIHGGGFCLGDLDSEEATARFVADSGLLVLVSVEYRLAPEVPWPGSLNDCIIAAKWALQKFSDSEDVDTSKLFIIGGSAGGQLALSLTIHLIEQHIAVAGVCALCPIAVGEGAVPRNLRHKYISIQQNDDAPLVPARTYRIFMRANGHDDADPKFSILLSPTLKEFPRTYIVTCGADVLRDDGYILVEKLRSFGVQVKHDNYHGYPHYFWLVPVIRENALFYRNLAEGLQYLLSPS